ncbi:MAG: peptidoglycan bridge formation glycyltransferase FemA/FemB family protein [Bacteroidales bacterium]|nr:peptidoglycan bridge formation glycyltransferase FemA/FemB family protein [Bacteroidales bacterium]MCF8349839.1 peptidoglycan bridge formation glycyltransferase FemA/FemB family protein [Bacteroidales bacterium]MCF8375565.1 peptidoglycan bridge formation glycyltransferase FemA/FemB family protein [Bacteroidales bacterium]
MRVEIDKKDVKQVSESELLQQTAYWAEVKKKHGAGPRAFDLKLKGEEIRQENNRWGEATDDLLILLQPVDREHYIAYVPYGPKLEPDEELQGPFLEELSEALRPLLPSGCIMIRYDLPWESPWAKDEDYFDNRNNWLGPPRPINQEIRMNFSTEKGMLTKAHSDILPSNTIFLNLKKDDQELLGRMKAKTRYNIRLSQRKGIEIERPGMEKLDVWYKLYGETARRNGIHVQDMSYFKTVLTARANHTNSPADVDLLVAGKNGTPLAAMFLAVSGNRATYLYGASSSVQRNCMATYALQWQAMKLAKEKGCTEYDMFGISPNPDPAHPMYGLYRFKSGFGGEIYHRMGCWDYPLDLEKYAYLQSSEMTSQGYHIN